MPARTALLFLMLLAFLFALVQIQVLQFTFEKLGLAPGNAMAILIATIAGSGINLPLFSIESETELPAPDAPVRYWRLFEHKRTGRIVIAVNVGGCIIPLALSLYLISLHMIALPPLILAVLIVSVVSYQFSSIIPGVGVGMPVILAPFTSAMLALVIDPEHAAQLAYICGVLGVLIGADLLRLPEIGRVGAPVASIGGAGTFDGIFITGIMAALLA